MVKIIESPREGMQGILPLISTEAKVRFINTLLKTGFDTVEIGSMVNPKIIPQMADTMEVIRKLDFSATRSERMILVMNRKGAERVASVEEVTTLSYPFAFTPSFLDKNVRSTVEEVFALTSGVINLCGKYGKKAVIYISYAYGNPYGDPWSLEILLEWVGKLRNIGARIISLSNVSVEIDETLIDKVFTAVIREYPDIEFGLHLHHSHGDWSAKVDAAYQAGCRRFDTVMNGFGGCPMSGNELMGNLNTMEIIHFLEQKKIPHGFDREILKEAVKMADEIYK